MFENIVTAALAKRTEKKIETPTEMTREQIETELKSLVETMLAHTGIETVSVSKVQRAGEKIADVLANLGKERKKSASVSLESDPVDPDGFGALPDKLGQINALSEEAMKKTIEQVYGGLPRGRFDRHSWGAKLFSDREYFVG